MKICCINQLICKNSWEMVMVTFNEFSQPIIYSARWMDLELQHIILNKLKLLCHNPCSVQATGMKTNKEFKWL